MKKPLILENDPAPARAGEKILVVEDDKKIAAVMAARLEAAGYQVVIANDGLEAIKQAVAGKPDLVVMDIWMPVGLGFSVAQRMQQLGLGDIPIIFMTASKIQGLRRTAARLGAAGFVEKPYKAPALLAAIATALDSHRRQPQAAPVSPVVPRDEHPNPLSQRTENLAVGPAIRP